MRRIRITKPTGSQILAAGSGILFSVSLFSSALGILGWICFVPLLVALQGKSASRSLRLGMISGTSMNLVSLYWLVGTLTRFGEIPLLASIAAVFIFCVYSSLQFGIFTWYISRLGLCRGKSVANALMISFAWVVAEFFFPVLFPYGIGVSQSYYPTVIQVVDTLGVNFLGFLMFFANVSVFYLLDDMQQRRKPVFAPPVISIAVIAIVLGYGTFRIDEIEELLETEPRVEIAMVQANFDYAEKNLDNEPIITEKHREMSREFTEVDIVIWPETSVQHWFPKEESVYRIDYQRNVVPTGHTAHFLIGGLSFIQDPALLEDGWDEEDHRKYNTAFLVDPQSNILGQYSKTRLFLLGEYFPWINEELKFLKRVFPMIGDLTPGEGPKVLEVPGKNLRIGPLICYEDIMAELSRNYVKTGANLLVNLTNDAWFGRSVAPHQHLLLSIPRAVETRRYLVRSTNSGISAIVSPTGEIEARTDIFTTENLKGEVVLIDSLETLYTRVGDIFAWVALAMTALFAAKKYLGRKYAD
ncbi:MAG: apolipoprotein N-acyltransferase [Candidatus Dadabacteria bacterium]|nr:apolipoprotein N-acyltransferase [Candidatus Dadabacteria bacterium]